jgi:hypothetical protein
MREGREELGGEGGKGKEIQGKEGGVWARGEGKGRVGEIKPCIGPPSFTNPRDTPLFGVVLQNCGQSAVGLNFSDARVFANAVRE